MLLNGLYLSYIYLYLFPNKCDANHMQDSQHGMYHSKFPLKSLKLQKWHRKKNKTRKYYNMYKTPKMVMRLLTDSPCQQTTCMDFDSKYLHSGHTWKNLRFYGKNAHSHTSCCVINCLYTMQFTNAMGVPESVRL